MKRSHIVSLPPKPVGYDKVPQAPSFRLSPWHLIWAVVAIAGLALTGWLVDSFFKAVAR